MALKTIKLLFLEGGKGFIWHIWSQ